MQIETYPYRGYTIKISTSDSNVYGMKNGKIFFIADREEDVENMIDSSIE